MFDIPVIDQEPSSEGQPVISREPSEMRWAFSLRFWNQIEYFGLSESPSKWFVSLLEKLKELSAKEIDKFISDGAAQNAWRYHAIDWNQKNIPIQHKDLDWVDHRYTDNPEEYPILQFQVSQALGRVVGFWDEHNIFNIILLDPLHNIQPSKRYNYKVDPCSPLSCEYSSLLYEFEQLKRNNHCSDDCKNKEKIDSVGLGTSYTNVMMHFLDDQEKITLESINPEDGISFTDLMVLGAEELKK